MRNKAIDMAKAIGIIFIIMSHSGYLFPFAKYFYYMYIPIFFVCAGYCFKPQETAKSEIKRTVKRLIIPLIFTRLLYLVYDFMPKIVHGDYSFCTLNTLFLVLRNNLYSRYCIYPFQVDGENLYTYEHGGSEWFFPALLLTSILFIFLRRMLNKKEGSYAKRCTFTVAVLFAMAMGLSKLPILLPWSLDTIPVCAIFMIFGDILRRKNFMEKPLSVKLVPVFIVLFLACKLIADYNLDVNLSVRIYGFRGLFSVALYVVNALNACFLTLIACKWFVSKDLFSSLAIVGRHTLFLYAINGHCMEILSSIMYKTAAASYDAGIFMALKVFFCIVIGVVWDHVYKKIKSYIKEKDKSIRL